MEEDEDEIEIIETKQIVPVFSFDRIPENTRKLCEELGGTVDFSVSYLINGTIPQKVPHAKNCVHIS